jgi:hypothetical protein
VETVSVERVAEAFVEVSDTLVDDFDVLEFLYSVTGRIAEFAGAVAGLHLAVPFGQLRFMACSDEAPAVERLFEVDSQGGPSPEAFRTGLPVSCPGLAEPEGPETVHRWPEFESHALSLEFRWAYAIPMRLRGDVIGVVSLLGREPGAMGPDDQAVVRALVAVATIGMLQERAIRRGTLLVRQLQGALDSRVVIEQAKGVLAHAWGVSVDEAFATLRKFARSRQRRLSEVAATVVREGPASVTDRI